ncbi:DODA-type extradiol aromatic ring-opening family dioxygenase [Ottowia pentelensis]|uniref:DODA-type extradiol aromatic ring-opening family dioxygenase n=1 Tax=Ottowia pentelensis TaxID=511108 RepID=UPI003640DE77
MALRRSHAGLLHPAWCRPLLLHGLEPARRLGPDRRLPARHPGQPAGAAHGHRAGHGALAGTAGHADRLGPAGHAVRLLRLSAPHLRAALPAPGAPALAERARALLAGAGIAATVDTQRGYDHGTFVPLLVAFPDADVPVLQVSLLGSLSAQAHLDYGRALAPLRDDGALIIGSGMSYHNMRGYGDPRSTPISVEFDRWLTDTLARPAAERDARLAAWDTAAGPAGRLCHPPRAEEHLLPLHVVAGAAGDGAGRKVFSDEVLRTTISAFRFD